MAKTYKELQEDATQAFRDYKNQQLRAIQIMDAIREMCIDELGFPAENLTFHPTEKPGDKDSAVPYSQVAIDRDEKGRWNVCLSARMLPSVGGGYLLTFLFLEAEFEADKVRLTLTGEGGKTVEISQLPGASKAKFADFLDAISAKIAETNDWLRTGEGQKPTIGFGQGN
jgi:hypothetical protein